MIVFPKTWREFGSPVHLKDIEGALYEVINEIDCANLSFSGGIDSSLLLYYLLVVKKKANTFTVANDIRHPDIYYSQMAISYFQERFDVKIPHQPIIIPNLNGDELVRAFYNTISHSISSIIAGDCIDELGCGYYSHQDLEEKTYWDYLKRVQVEHIQPLNDNSGGVAVYLPYADGRIANLFYRIPLYEKVNKVDRKIINIELARGKIPQEFIEREKYGFATNIKKVIV